MTWNSRIHGKDVHPEGTSQTDLIREAVETLEQALDEHDAEDILFLWTGGKEAQVIADLLLYTVGGDNERSPVTFGTIDTGNHFDEMYDFREDYVAATGDQGAQTVGPFTGVQDVVVETHDEFLEHIIENEHDPRGYHGEHTGEWLCPECEQEAVLNRYTVQCGACGADTQLHPVQRQNTQPGEWGVPESCGVLKVVPLKRFIEDHGFDVLITGRRGDDTVVQTDENDDLARVEDRDEPVPHTRINPLANWHEANVWAYIKAESVSYPALYDQGYRHTDAECCTDPDQQVVGEYGEGGVDPQKDAAKDRLQDMGYI